MKKALIITGGYLNTAKISLSEAFDMIIAADSGYIAAQKLQITPTVILGDFDSAAVPNTKAELIILPAEKDDTDTMFACKLAVERGATDLLILGGTGGRVDHFLSNLFLLQVLHDQKLSAILTDGENTLRVLQDETILVPNRGGYFSLFALSDCSVTLSGCKYPLKNYTLPRDNPSFAVSNEVIGDSATVTISGKAILCECQK